MPPTKPRQDDLTALRADVAELREQLEELGATRDELEALHDDVFNLRREIRARGAEPNPRRELSPEAKAIRARNIAIARAAKGVGRGQGKVRTFATKKKLAADAKKVGGDS